MQKFVVKKISRSTNITIAASEDQSLLPCGDLKPQVSEDLEVSSIKMSGYLKKKRNVSFAKPLCNCPIANKFFFDANYLR